MKTIRCAIYTRKSSEDGLEQDFNSLDAQREACAAYILSQASEGWKLLPGQYDDGGLSGGTLERPALQRLLEDVATGRIDIIVVYKVDRLTRSLLDFAKLVEAFDEAKTSFVSVTQSFNTTTSMGRLTLNMLLSFAQFEREVTAERIRDKIAASKAKGMWMGGTPPLGYEPQGRSLKIVEDHADLIRQIFKRYLVLGNVRKLAEELDGERIRSPQRQTAKGKAYGGCRFSRGQLYKLLKNPIYTGDIAHKGKAYAGNHEAIIERETWDAVQAKLASNCQGKRGATGKDTSLLSGKLSDPNGDPLIPVHTSKSVGTKAQKKRYRYYVSASAHHQPGTTPSPRIRIPATEIEQVVRNELATLLSDPLQLAQRCCLPVPPSMFEPTTIRAAEVAKKIDAPSKRIVRKLVRQIIVQPGRLELEIEAAGLAELLGIEAGPKSLPTLTHSIQASIKRTGRVVKLIDDRGVPAASNSPNAVLTRLLAQARIWWGELAEGEIDVATLARREKVTASYITRVIRMAFLAPEVVDKILAGTVRAEVDGKALLATGAIDIDWGKQAANFLPSD